MVNIALNTNAEQQKLIEKYKDNKKINLQQELLKKAMELIEDYEDSLAIEKAEKENEGKPTYTLEEVCKMNGIDYETL